MSMLLARRRLIMANSNLLTHLYNLGDQCEALTGGWDATLQHNANSGVFKVNDTYLELYTVGTGSYNPRRENCVTQNSVSTVEYSKVCVRWSAKSNAPTSMKFSLGLYESSTKYELSFITHTEVAVNGGSEVITELPLTSYQGDYYIGMYSTVPTGVGSTSVAYSIYIHEVWLE